MFLGGTAVCDLTVCGLRYVVSVPGPESNKPVSFQSFLRVCCNWNKSHRAGPATAPVTARLGPARDPQMEVKLT